MIAEALHAAGVSPEAVSYVEAHGTGTPVGDPIEVAALNRAYGSRLRGPLCLGSVKPNIGHLGTAAGIASLIKTVLVLEKRRFVRTLHFRTPNPEADFASGPLCVITEDRSWIAPDRTPRIAGVSSFGLGGYNSHVIVQEPPPEQRHEVTNQDPEPRYLIPLSAASARALRGQARALATDMSLGDVAVTLATGREHMRHRVGLVVRDRAALERATRDIANGRRGTEVSGEPRIAFLFTGHSPDAEWDVPGLLRHRSTQDVLQAADPVIRELLGAGLHALLLGDAAHLVKRHPLAVGQPVQFVLQAALTRMWLEWGIAPRAVLGHSLGEYAAAHAAGALDLETGIRLVVERAHLLASLPAGGAMGVLGLDPEQAEALVEQFGGRLTITAYNGPSNVVVAGDEPLVTLAVARATAAGASARLLRFGTAGHSSHVDPVLSRFRAAVADRRLRPPTVQLAPSAVAWSIPN